MLDFNERLVVQMQSLLKTFMLRRTKNEVLKDEIPKKKEIDIYVGLTYLQIQMYQNILKSSSLEGEGGRKHHNILMQLRKICCHPYLFEGVEDPD